MHRLLIITSLIGLMNGVEPAMAQVPTAAPATTPGAHVRRAADSADARSAYAGVRQGDGLARRRECSGEGRWKFHSRADAQSGIGDDGEGRGTAGGCVHVHDGIGGQQNLSRNHARAEHVRHGRSGQPDEDDCHDEPRRALQPQGDGVCSQAICTGDGGAVYRGRGRAGQGVIHGVGQPDCAEAGAGDDCDFD